jgi:hypothetical protein
MNGCGSLFSAIAAVICDPEGRVGSLIKDILFYLSNKKMEIKQNPHRTQIFCCKLYSAMMYVWLKVPLG